MEGRLEKDVGVGEREAEDHLPVCLSLSSLALAQNKGNAP